MRRNIMLGVAVGAVIALGSAGGAFAGEIGGHGQEPQGPNNSASLCAFSGLEDFDDLAPVDPGVVQNWGHIPQEARKAFSDRGAAQVVIPGLGEEGCNAHLYPNPNKGK